MIPIKKIFNDDVTNLNLILKSWKAFSSIFSLFFILQFLDDIEQGYYYTFLSLLGIQVLFELGFTQVFVIKASYLTEKFNFFFKEKIKIDSSEFLNLSSLIKFGFKFYSIASILLGFTLMIIGLFFFSNENTDLINWKLPWGLLVFSTCLNLILSPFLAFLEGTGYYKDSIKIRLYQSFISIIFLWISITTGLKLYSIFILNITVFIVGFYLINKKFGNHFRTLIFNNLESNLNWKKEILPLQSKIAISWICGYLQFQLFNPILFKFEGPIVAGKFGLALTIISGITSLSLAFIQPKVPLFSNLASLKKIDDLNKLFKYIFNKVNVVSITLLLGFFIIFIIFDLYFENLINRTINPYQFLILGLASYINIIVTSYAYYLRSYYKEPLMFVSIYNALAISISVIIFTPLYGLNGMLICYLLSNLIISFNLSHKKFKSQINV